jgi:hypothetical protein
MLLQTFTFQAGKLEQAFLGTQASYDNRRGFRTPPKLPR